MCDSEMRNDFLEGSAIGRSIWKTVSDKPRHLAEWFGGLRREENCIGEMHYLRERGIETGKFLEETSEKRDYIIGEFIRGFERIKDRDMGWDTHCSRWIKLLSKRLDKGFNFGD